jgi:hypothetical protein
MNYIDQSIYSNVELLPKDISGWNGLSSVFAKLISETKPSLIIEVGTWKGQSAINMANFIKKNKYQTKILCIDTWLGALEFWDSLAHTPERNLLLKNGYPQIYYQFLSNVIHAQVEDIILPFPNTSDTAYRYLINKKIKSELIYIDASHEEEDVYRDVSNYYNMLSFGGIIFGDDYNNWIGVNKSIRKFCQEKNLSFEVLENNYWIIRRTLDEMMLL